MRLTPLLKENFAYLLSESEMDLGLAALSAAIENMPSLHVSGTENKFSLKKYTLGQYLRLDVAALKSLNVFPQQSGVENGVSGQAGSLFGLLNQCKTQIGARLLKKWLKQPTTNRSDIELRHEIVQFFLTNEHIRSDVQGIHLRTFPDLEKLYAKFYRVQAKMRHNAQLIDCVKVYNMIHTLESMVTFLNENVIDEQSGLRKEVLEPLNGTLEEF